MTATTKTTRQRRIVHDYDLVGWDAIAGALDVSIRKAQDLAQMSKDPLPVKRLIGRMRASSAAVRDWAERNARAA